MLRSHAVVRLSPLESRCPRGPHVASTVCFGIQVWGDALHTGRYGLLEGEDTKLEGKARIDRAMELAGEHLLQKVFCPGGPSPDTCTILDMGGALGELARMAVSKYGCKVSLQSPQVQ